MHDLLSILTAGSTRCATNGCSCRRSAAQRPWQGQVDAGAGAARRLRSRVLPLPGERARGRRSQSALHVDVRLRQRLSCADASTTPDDAHPPTLRNRCSSPSRSAASAASSASRPRHDLTLARMEPARHPRGGRYLGRGVRGAGRAADGCATRMLVREPRRDDGRQQSASTRSDLGDRARCRTSRRASSRRCARHRARTATCLLCDYVARERACGERIVCDNDGFVALVPFWAAWPFETLVAEPPSRRVARRPADAERDALADMLKQLTARYDNLFESAFPYSMGFHQPPVRGGSPAARGICTRISIRRCCDRPRVRKFMVGFELLGSPQRDMTPEEAAARLQAVSGCITALERRRSR